MQSLYDTCLVKGKRIPLNADKAVKEWERFFEVVSHHLDLSLVIDALETAPSADCQFVMDALGPSLKINGKAMVLTSRPTESRRWEVKVVESAIRSWVREDLKGTIDFLPIDTIDFPEFLDSLFKEQITKGNGFLSFIKSSRWERQLLEELFCKDLERWIDQAGYYRVVAGLIDLTRSAPWCESTAPKAEGGDLIWGWLPSSDISSSDRRRRVAFLGSPVFPSLGRTNYAGLVRLATALICKGERVIPVRYDNSREALHLSTAFTPLGKNARGEEGLLVSPSVHATTLKLLGYVIVDTAPGEEWAAGGFPGLIAGGGPVVLPAQFPKTLKRVEEAGFQFATVDNTQTSGIDGSLHCWVRDLYIH